MRKITRIASISLAGVVSLALVGLSWLLFYSLDLPDIRHLRRFAPTSPVVLTDDCLGKPVTAIPYNQMGKSLQNAVAVEDVRPNRVSVSLQIARTLFCQPEKHLSRALRESRAALQLDLRFSHEELLTIYLNRIAMGECGYGVETAASCRSTSTRPS